ncbi:MAG: YtxH domain-containing protein [Victivallales bacterium]|nr:YtxH domain-containing protein [Victivallales bacterium]
MKKGLKKLIYGLVILVVIIIAVLIIGLLSLDSAVRIGGEQVVGKLTNCETHIGDVSIHPFSGHVVLKDVLIKNPKTDTKDEPTNFSNEDFFKLGLFDVDLNMKSLLSDEIHVSKVQIESPEITFEKTPLSDSNLNIIMSNIDKLMPAKSEEEEEKKPETEEDKDAKKFVIDILQIKDVRVNVSTLGLTAPLIIPEINLKDLGKPGAGITAGEAIKITFTALFTSIIEGVKGLGVAVLDLGKSAGSAIIEGGKAITEGGKNIINNLIGSSKDSPEDQKDDGKSVKESGKETKEAAKETGKEIKEAAKETKKEIKEAAKEAGKDLKESGKGIINNILGK